METVIDGVYLLSRVSNAYIVDGDDGVVLIDTGIPNRHGAIIEGLSDIGRSAKDVRAILVTHGHFDHFGSAAALRSASGAPVYASPIDAPVIRGERPAQPPPVLEHVPIIPSLMKLLTKATPLPVDHVVTEGLHRDLPGAFTVIATPGHTIGHVSYLLDRAGGVLFVGDAATNKRGTIKRGWFNRSTDTIDESIRKLATHEFATACFGHSAPLTSDASAAFARFPAAR